MSDLQCAARLFLARAADGPPERASLAESVAPQRIARAWSSPLAQARGTADDVAARLGVDVVVRPELAEVDIEQLRGVLEEVADLHRGESVLVVTEGDVIDRAVPLLAANLRRDRGTRAPLRPGGVVQLDGDADGWTVRSWDGTPLA